MIEEIVSELVKVLASAGSGALAGSAARAIGELAAGLRARFQKYPAAHDALEAAVKTPTDIVAMQDLAVLIGRCMKEDPDFSAWLQSEWGQVRPLLVEADGSVSNIVSGGVSGNVVQARSIAGGIHFGPPPHKSA